MDLLNSTNSDLFCTILTPPHIFTRACFYCFVSVTFLPNQPLLYNDAESRSIRLGMNEGGGYDGLGAAAD